MDHGSAPVQRSSGGQQRAFFSRCCRRRILACIISPSLLLMLMMMLLPLPSRSRHYRPVAARSVLTYLHVSADVTLTVCGTVAEAALRALPVRSSLSCAPANII